MSPANIVLCLVKNVLKANAYQTYQKIAIPLMAVNSLTVARTSSAMYKNTIIKFGYTRVVIIIIEKNMWSNIQQTKYLNMMKAISRLGKIQKKLQKEITT